ncbi:MAG: nitroreductase/quinone reductase family protein [Candidatus Limnocylindrales bacterium]
MVDWDPAAFTKGLIADIREHGGAIASGPMAGRKLLVLTTTGAKTGQPREAVLTYSRDGDAYVVAGSKQGMPTNPAWFANLVANPTVTIETEGMTTQAIASVAEGSDRDALWDRHVAAYPSFADYVGKTGGRVIPMIRLTPIS